MRGSSRRRHEEHEAESVLVSMTDMTVSFLLIVMILLAFFANQIRADQDEPVVPQRLYERELHAPSRRRPVPIRRKLNGTGFRRSLRRHFARWLG